MPQLDLGIFFSLITFFLIFFFFFYSYYYFYLFTPLLAFRKLRRKIKRRFRTGWYRFSFVYSSLRSYGIFRTYAGLIIKKHHLHYKYQLYRTFFFFLRYLNDIINILKKVRYYKFQISFLKILRDFIIFFNIKNNKIFSKEDLFLSNLKFNFFSICGSLVNSSNILSKNFLVPMINNLEKSALNSLNRDILFNLDKVSLLDKNSFSFFKEFLLNYFFINNLCFNLLKDYRYDINFMAQLYLLSSLFMSNNLRQYNSLQRNNESINIIFFEI